MNNHEITKLLYLSISIWLQQNINIKLTFFDFIKVTIYWVLDPTIIIRLC